MWGQELAGPGSAASSVLCTGPGGRHGLTGEHTLPPSLSFAPSLSSFGDPRQSPSSLPTGLRPDPGLLDPWLQAEGDPGKPAAEKGRPGTLDAPEDAAGMLRCGR